MDKDAMIRAYERGECSYTGMVDHYIDTMRSGADMIRKQEKENAPDKKEEDK